MLLVTLLLACGGGGGDGDASVHDSSYPYYTVLEQAAARCDDDAGELVLTARTRGWKETATARVYVPASNVAVDVVLDTVFARQDEYCDYMRAEVPLADLQVASCTELELPSLWLAYQIAFEEGCAGCALSTASDPAVIAKRIAGCDATCDPEQCFLVEVPLNVDLGADATECVRAD